MLKTYLYVIGIHEENYRVKRKPGTNYQAIFLGTVNRCTYQLLKENSDKNQPLAVNVVTFGIHSPMGVSNYGPGKWTRKAHHEPHTPQVALQKRGKVA